MTQILINDISMFRVIRGRYIMPDSAAHERGVCCFFMSPRPASGEPEDVLPA